MKARADFHIHTHHSPDSGARASDILECARRAGLDVIGVTDHNTTRGALEVRGLARVGAKAGKPPIGRRGGMPLVLVGQEVRTAEGEIIVFGPEKDIARGIGILETCKAARAMGGFIITPHPFDSYREGAGKALNGILGHIDAMETLNARCFSGKANRKAAAFAAENELPAVAGSDAHFPEEIGSCFTEVEVEGGLTEKNIFDAITSGRTSVHGRRSGLKPHIKTMLHRLV